MQIKKASKKNPKQKTTQTNAKMLYSKSTLNCCVCVVKFMCYKDLRASSSFKEAGILN